MRILHIIPSLDKKSGGPAQVIWDFIDLTKADFSYEVCSTNEGLSDKEINHLQEEKTIPIHCFSYSGTHSTKRSLALFSWLKKECVQFDLVYIHAGFSLISEVSALICGFKKIPFVYRPLGTLSPYSLKAGRSFFKSMALFLEKRQLNRALWVHATSKIEKQDILALAPKANVEIIPLPIKSQFLSAKLQQKPLMLGFLSRIHPKKNIELILNVLSDLELKPHFRLIIAGTGEENYLSELKDFIQQNNLEQVVNFIGFIEGENKIRFFDSINWFVLPSFHENFSVATAEALSFGVPCITSKHVDVAVFDEQSDAIIRLDNSAEEWKTTLKMILNESPENYALRVDSASNYVKTHFSADKVKQLLTEKLNPKTTNKDYVCRTIFLKTENLNP